MKILIDCRCLNYAFFTGVNAFTIRFLHSFLEIKSKRPEIIIVAMGFKPGRLEQLKNKFTFISDLFDLEISLNEYLASKLPQKILETKIIFQNLIFKRLDRKNIKFYDYVILPQPRLIWLNPRSKLITIFHDLYNILINDKKIPQSLVFSQRSCQSLVDRSHKVIAVSISTGSDIKKLFIQNIMDESKIQLIYPALPNLRELESNINKSKLFENEISGEYILAISGIESRKNWTNLLLAHHHLNLNFEYSYKLVLAGAVVDTEYYNQLLNLIDTLNIKNVVWRLDPDELHKNKLIEGSNFLIYPSFYEGFGFPILEAFEYNKSVITSKISSMPEIGKNACFYVNPFNFVSIANGIWVLCADKNFHNHLKSNIASIKNIYNWSELTTSFDKILK